MLEADHLPGRTLLATDGREYLYCSGTSYLGMARNPAFAALLAEGLSRYGSNYGNSRNGPLRLRIYAEAERYLAAYTGAAAALTVSSGYLAGQMAVKALARAGRFEYAPGTHPAAWLTEHAPLPTAPRPFDDWAAHLLRRLQHETPEPVVIVSNSLDPLRAQRYDFAWTQHLPTNRPITLLIDDSHGFGVIGPGGAGIFRELRVPPSVRVVVVSSLGKACGIPGGVVLSEARFIDELRQSAFFGASSPVVPAYLHAFVQAEELYGQARAQLAANVQQFAAATADTELFQGAPGFPVFYTPRNELADFMLQRGVLLSSFAYPTAADPCITRVVLSALHTAEDVARVAELCMEFTAQTHL
ncbi:pyridoxal phosphate-dependent aminotransferase family protein [Hymenobacter busanensis]|uniref:Pyridoxal phosphate-dependent aminotransferase family protein n=1 Tax=Hymenobacter busanensis TaxID=2607656 RepID=A0A7L4ZXP0_9BACT|nr:aminotransferase class I/II-fold pyridoxal phosphate-dependent enzyme [Hymenobacter busanensis]KAA9333051.1 pyridoxal phosphate-dependent aminotransferase family protein [Hymenobacter busanensis]QHJ08274.1 aminotransferase class I/II-fold pyridoxal phosphate-dependent enzyme [Hymenobacter busanensis]